MGIEKSFGAEVKVTLPDPEQRQLFMVVFSSLEVGPAAVVRAHGGRIVLDGGAWIIAELAFNVATSLRNSTDIVFLGGISLDPERFATFSRLTGLNPLNPQ